jgi:Ca2+-binding RTX toxin-like protein
VLTFSSSTGDFATFNGLTFGDGIVLQPQFAAGDTGLNLLAFATTATTVTSSATNNTAAFGQTESFTANVTAGDGSIPTGSVQFQLNGVNFGSPVNLVNGSATIDASSLPAGTYQVTVIYSGSGAQFDLGSTSAPLTYTVNPDPTTTTLTSSTGITAVGQSVTFTATVTANAPGSGTPTGAVSFYDGTTLLDTINLPAGGPDQVSVTTSALAVGTHTITAVYSGDSNFVTSSSAGASEIILGPGVAVFGTSLYVVGADTADYVQINPVGTSNTGSTGLQVNSLLNNTWSSQTFSQPITDVYVFGDNGNDTIQMANTLTVNAHVTEGNGSNYIQTAGGNDVITLGTGSNTIFSGNGNKTITAQDAAGTSSYIQLGTGTDVVSMGAGNDQVVLGAGNNTVTAGDGNDAVQAGNGNNTITLGNGNEYIHTGNGADVITVGNGTATIETGTGNKTITAGNGNDFVQASTGTDVLTLGNGNDTVELGDGNNTVTLGDGRDFVQAGNGNNTVTVGNANGDTVLVGNGDNVVVTGNGNGVYVQAGNGDNLIAAGTGAHTVIAGSGSNILIDGSVALTHSGDSLRAILTDWKANGASDASEIRARLLVTYNTSNANYLAAGSGLDWFWDTFSGDTTNMKPTDLLN